MKKPSTKVLITDLLDLYSGLLVPFMMVERDMSFAGDTSRNETDAEHAFTLAMVALTVNERLGFGLDRGKLALYALVHDLVEAYAGDISVLADDVDLAKKAENERQAFEMIKARYAVSAPWIAPLIHEYESRNDLESRFVYAVDKHMGGLTRMSMDGEKLEVHYPHADGKHFKQVVGRLRQKVEQYPELLELFDELHEQVDQARLRRLANAAPANHNS